MRHARATARSATHHSQFPRGDAFPWITKDNPSTTRNFRDFSSGNNEVSCVNKSLYLHVPPSGDVWTGHEMFAAKHLQPDYVKSVSLEGEAPVIVDGTLLIELLEER